MSKRRRMRLPNGFGQISEIKSGRLRKPFRAMVTVGKNEVGRPIVKPLKPESYFKTYNEAYSALMKYHENPYDLDQNITVKDIYERWLKRKYDADPARYSHESKASMMRAWGYCKSIENMQMVDLRVKHIKFCMENGIAEVKGVSKTPEPPMKILIKQLMNQLFDYAIEYDIVQTNYARLMKMPRELMKEATEIDQGHVPYTDEEIKVFWNHVGQNIIADIAIVQCYSGWRPQEMLNLTTDDVNITEWTFTGGLKTEAGKNRVVPIHSKIKEIVKRAYDKASKSDNNHLFYRITRSGSHVALSYRYFLMCYHEFIEKHNMSSVHRPHDGRTHFVTQAKKYNVDEYAIKKLVGHTITDLTEKVYTKRDLEWYRSEIEKIK